MKTTKIITHSGRAHLDDFLSVCLLLHKHPSNYENSTVVLRMDEVTDKELGDSGTYVVDMGRRLEPRWLNFDHHQLSPNIINCSFTLLLEHFGMRDYDALPWIRFVETYDHRGPVYAMKDCLDSSARFSLLDSPIQEFFIQRFSEAKTLSVYNSENSNLAVIMQSIGKLIEDEYLNYHKVAKRRSDVTLYHINNYVVGDFRDFTGDELNSNAAATIQKLDEIDIVLSKNDRSGGPHRMMRVNEDKVDFNKIKNEEGVGFVHGSGFLVCFDGDFKKLVEKL